MPASHCLEGNHSKVDVVQNSAVLNLPRTVLQKEDKDKTVKGTYRIMRYFYSTGKIYVTLYGGPLIIFLSSGSSELQHQIDNVLGHFTILGSTSERLCLSIL